MRAFVLSLARRPERLERFMAWNRRHGLDFAVVPAVDGATLDRGALAAQGLLDRADAPFTAGALGNALSHRAQWLDCIADGAPRLVCEDDACLHGTLPAQMPALARALDGCDLVFLGYNTDAPLGLMLPDRMMTEMYFGSLPGEGDRYDAFAGATGPRPRSVPHAALTVWGTIAYMVAPAGARRLLECCFPLSASGRLTLHVERRQVAPVALDGRINLALHAGKLRAVACVPPLALSPNDRSDVSAASAFSSR